MYANAYESNAWVLKQRYKRIGLKIYQDIDRRKAADCVETMLNLHCSVFDVFTYGVEFWPEVADRRVQLVDFVFTPLATEILAATLTKLCSTPNAFHGSKGSWNNSY